MKGMYDFMKKIFVLGILNIATYLLAFLTFPAYNLLGLLLLLLNIIFIPAFYCAFIKHLAESAEVSKKVKVVVTWTSFLAIIAADILACIIRFKGIMVFYMPTKGVWYLICGIWALLNHYLDRPSGNKKATKILTITFATVSLILNAFLFFPFAPWHELIKYEVLLILPFLFAFISIFSYLIGKAVSEPRKRVKLIAWLLGIMASILSLARCYGAFGFGLIVYGISATVIMFIFSIVGLSRQEKKRKRLNANYRENCT